MHPSYNLDPATSNYYSFMFMANDFTVEKLASREACENILVLSQVFANRPRVYVSSMKTSMFGPNWIILTKLNKIFILMLTYWIYFI